MRRPKAIRYPYRALGRTLVGREPNAAPWLPVELTHVNTVRGHAMIDSGADAGVLPFSIGEQLGLSWENNRFDIRLGGVLNGLPAKAVFIKTKVASFKEVEVAFGWIKTDDAPLILGRMNFLQLFDVCLYGSEAAFEIRPSLHQVP